MWKNDMKNRQVLKLIHSYLINDNWFWQNKWLAFFNILTFIFYEELFPFLGNICLNNIAALIFNNKYVILKP
jgi:hypothetical protein